MYTFTHAAQRLFVYITCVACIGYSTNLFGQLSPTVKTPSACSSCTGVMEINAAGYDLSKLSFTLNDGKKDIAGVESTDGKVTFPNVCPGIVKAKVKFEDEHFSGACTMKEFSGTMTASGEGTFTVTLVSNANNRIEVSTTATNPRYAWSNSSDRDNILESAAAGVHFVTVTDGLGCTKVGGPFEVSPSCYDAQGNYVGVKFEIQIGREGFSEPSFVNTGEPMPLNVKLKSGNTLSEIPSNYVIKWYDQDNNWIGTGSRLTLSKDATAWHNPVKVVVSNNCESREASVKMIDCKETNKDVLADQFVEKTEASCLDVQLGDMKNGKAYFKIPKPSTGNVTLTMGTNSVFLTNTSTNFLFFEVDDLAIGNHNVSVNIAGLCIYNFTVEIESTQPEYIFRFTDKKQCAFYRKCKSGGFQTFFIPGTNFRTHKDKDPDSKSCSVYMDCVAGNVISRDHKTDENVDVITTYTGLFKEILFQLQSASGLTPNQSKSLFELCRDFDDAKRCGTVKFCPESFEVISATKPNGRRFRTDELVTINGMICREMACGTGKRYEKRSTCDPELLETIKITNPELDRQLSCDDPCDCTDVTMTAEELLAAYDQWRQNSGVFFEAERQCIGSSFVNSELHKVITDNILPYRGANWSKVECRKITFCNGGLGFKIKSSVFDLSDIQAFDCPIQCNEPPRSITVQDILNTSNLRADLYSLVQYLKVKNGYSEGAILNAAQKNFLAEKYKCLAIFYCQQNHLIDNYREIKATIDGFLPCPIATGYVFSTLNKLVVSYLSDKSRLSPAALIEKWGPSDAQLRRLLEEAKSRHNDGNSVTCTNITYTTPNFEVYDFDAKMNFASDLSKSCPGTRKFTSGEAPTTFLTYFMEHAANEHEEVLPKVYRDSIGGEQFLHFAPLVYGEEQYPKALLRTDGHNQYYNYSHDIERVGKLERPNLVFQFDNWDEEVSASIEQTTSSNEYLLTAKKDSSIFAAPLESDSLLHFTHFTVRDSFLYLSGYYTGALRYRAELVDDQPTHAHLNGFVLRINQQGDLRGAAIIENIDTTLNGFRVALGKTGDVLVAGKVKSSTLRINQNDAATGLIGGGFVGTLHANTHAFSLLNRIDLEANAQILRAAVEPNQAAYALLVGNTNGVAQQAGSLQVGNGNKVAALSLTTQGALQWVKYFNGNIDPRQLDITFGVEQRLNVGITYAGNVSIDTTQYFSSQGKQDIGLIQFDQQGQSRWHRSYGSPETETVVELLYDAGILYFGGNFAGAQSFRSIGGYDFYNPTPFHERAYVSYYADSVAVDSTLANTPELAALSAPVLQKSSTPDRTFKVFPNPFKDEILTEFEAQNSENMSIEVLNELGRVVKTQRFGATPGFNRQQISTQQFPAGIYFIYLRNQAGRVLKVQKLVKM